RAPLLPGHRRRARADRGRHQARGPAAVRRRALGGPRPRANPTRHPRREERLMDLASYVARYPNVRVAGRADNERILEFYRKLGMQGGGFNILFVKDPDYFRFLDCESDAHAVCVVEDDDGNVEGMFAF